MNRRDAVRAILLASGSMFGGCCTVKTLTPTIGGDIPNDVPLILKPAQIHKATSAPRYCLDVHAHFFNASDVPVKGLLEGPIAHLLEGQLGNLVRLLAPFMQRLADVAPDAGKEFRTLLPGGRSAPISSAELARISESHLQQISTHAYEVLRGSDFEREYNRIIRSRGRQVGAGLPTSGPFGRDTVRSAMELGRRRRVRDTGPDLSEPESRSQPYPEGLLAFVGYMLSYRFMNLQAYQGAFSTDDDAFGIDQVCGAMVDFNHWLDCYPVSPLEDQIRVHQLLSVLSAGYMRPVVCYNPWSDAVSGGYSLSLVEQAVNTYGFVGVKIYPPSGFRPYGNAGRPPLRGAPSWEVIDATLLHFWTKTVDWNVPVMAHTSQSMGEDDAHDELASYAGWAALLDQFTNRTPPKISLGHFGGDKASNQWTHEMAKLMRRVEGRNAYGDIAYWDSLECGSLSSCPGRTRLKDALDTYDLVKQRVMYGSDWLMMSREPDWKAYPQRIAASTADLIVPADLFGGNALHCFSRI